MNAYERTQKVKARPNRFQRAKIRNGSEEGIVREIQSEPNDFKAVKTSEGFELVESNNINIVSNAFQVTKAID